MNFPNPPMCKLVWDDLSLHALSEHAEAISANWVKPVSLPPILKPKARSDDGMICRNATRMRRCRLDEGDDPDAD